MTRTTISLPIQSADAFGAYLDRVGRTLTRRAVTTLQINVGKMCNLACHHCHVESSPKRTEIMTWETMARILDWLDAYQTQVGIQTVDLTGGAPEMNPNFKRLVRELHQREIHVLDRCNLTILLEPGYEDYAAFMAEHRVEIVASLPCYSSDNVDKQRGKGVFDESVRVLQMFNRLGYGVSGSGLKLDLVYNPVGYGLPPDQQSLERDYKRELQSHFGIVFNKLWTITNMPIKRFEHALHRDGQYDVYMNKLVAAHNDANIDGVMCRDLVSVGWQGSVYDCDFNQMLQMPIDGPGGEEHFVEANSRKLWEFSPAELLERPIRTGSHCFGCTAGAGSSCTGQLS